MTAQGQFNVQWKKKLMADKLMDSGDQPKILKKKHQLNFFKWFKIFFYI